MASSCEICGGRHATGECSPEIAQTGAFARTAKMQRAAKPDLDVDTLVGEYRVVRRIGEGGMGIVYEGVHPLLGRKVAIKILNDLFARSDEASARFLQEARAASLVRHRNIVDVFAFGQLPDGRYYQVMEFLDGKDLSDLLEEHGVLGVEAVRVIVGGVLAALEVAHGKDIIHRDLKPDNIFVNGDLAKPDELAVKILDFGLAKLIGVEGDVSLVKSRTGAPMGTPAYMSPEQCRAVGAIDHRSDLYSVGILLAELYTGHAPFDAESVLEVMNMHLQVAPPSLRAAIGMPAILDEVIQKALAKKPEDRFQSAAEMHAALDLASFEASAFVPPPRVERPKATDALGATQPSNPKPTPRTPPPSVIIAPADGAEEQLPRSWVGPLLFALILAGGVGTLVYVGTRPRPAAPAMAAPPPPPRIAALRIEVSPPSRVLLDGKELGVGATEVQASIDPGPHQLHIESDGHLPHDRAFTLSAGETLTVAVTLPPAPKPKQPPRRHGL